MAIDEQQAAELRRFIVVEVAAQLKPFADLLQDTRNWQLAFWSNGVGKFPGFFQMRMKEDDERHEMVKQDLKSQNDKLVPVLDYLERQRLLRELSHKRWEFWRPILRRTAIGFFTGLLSLGIWLVPKAFRVADILWQDYLHYHPAVTQQLSTDSSAQRSSVPVQASSVSR